GDRYRPRVGNVGQQRSEGDNELRPEHLGKLGDQAAERAPAKRRLAAREQDQVARGARNPSLIELHGRPHDLPCLAVDQLDPRARGLEVVEFSGSIRAKRLAPSAEPTNVIALEAASAASFQPLNAHTRAGARSPSGRCSHCNGCIRTTVHPGHMSSADITMVAVGSRRAGQPVKGVFACTRKDRLMTRSGSPYLALELRDRTGTVTARAFQNADELAGRFERGDVVAVSGRVERFRDDLVLEVAEIARVAAESVDPGRFLPSAYRDLDELDGFLEHLAGQVFDPGYRALLDGLLADAALRAAWRRAPCTRNGHHAYLGGLLEHTVAVATLAHEFCQLHP